MSINMKKYVDIKSRVGGTGGVPRRELILRLFTTNTLVSPATPLEFTSAKAVGDLFGTSSPEYLRAKQYFSYVAPDFSAPSKISFGRDITTATAPQVIGTTPKPVSEIIATGAVTFGVTVSIQGGPPTRYPCGITLSGLSSYADIAAAMQASMRSRFKSETYASLKAASLTYDGEGNRFIYMGEAGEELTVSFADANSAFTRATGLYGTLDNDSSDAVVISGTALVAPSSADSVALSIDASNNFGTFSFIRELSLEKHLAIAIANAERNVAFEYVVPVTLSNYASWSAALIGIEGTTLVLVGDSNTEYDEQIPGAIKAAVNYSKTDSVVNYMFRQMGGITPKCTSDTLSDALDAARINYYGETQQAGKKISFFQRGVMMGGDTSPVDENVYANEQWLKDDLAAGFMELLLSVGRVSDNAAGKNKLTNTIQTTLDLAVNNGSVSVGKTLSNKQKAFISQVTGDDRAWIQVQNIGYWYTVDVEAYTTDDGRTEYKGVYTLLYSKDDAIRKVEGLNILI